MTFRNASLTSSVAFPFSRPRVATVDAMAATPDGGAIYALLHAGGRIVRLDAASGRVTGEVPGSGYDRLAAVVPW